MDRSLLKLPKLRELPARADRRPMADQPRARVVAPKVTRVQIPLSAVQALDARHDPRDCPFCWGADKL